MRLAALPGSEAGDRCRQPSSSAVAAAQAVTVPRRPAQAEVGTGAHRERLVGWWRRRPRLLRGARQQRRTTVGVLRPRQWRVVCARGVRLMAYAELHCLSNFTFLRGASHPEELVARAHELGYTALALTDECSFAGIVRAHVAAKECGLKLIVGSEIRLVEGPHVVLLATDRAGYGKLSAIITHGRRSAAKGNYKLALGDLGDGVPGCLVLLLAARRLRVREHRDQRVVRRRIAARTLLV